MPQVLKTQTHKAIKKEHICNYCGCKIKLMEEYKYSSMVHYGDFYVWRVHLSCGWVAGYLDFFSECDEGLDMDTFQECISNEYSNIMRNHFNGIWESESYEIPCFHDQLDFVIRFHSERA